MKKIKVLALIEARIVTGPAKNLLRFASDCRNDVDLTAITFERTAATSNPTPRNLFIAAASAMNIPVRIVRESGRFDWRVLRSLAGIFEEQQPDIVQTHAVKSHFLVSLLRKRKFAWIGFHHGYTSEDLKMRMYHQFDRLSLKQCDRVVTVCQPFAESLIARGVSPQAISVIPNSIREDFLVPDASVAQETRLRLGIMPGTRVALTIGRLSPEKGHKFLVAAVSTVVEALGSQRLQMLIAGQGQLQQELSKQISAAGLEDTVKLIGHHSDIKPLFMIADLFVLPSLSEGSPNVILESMAARVPLVASAVGGVPETVIDGESALLVPAADSQALAKAMIAVLTDRQLGSELAESAFIRVRQFFSPPNYDARLMSVYRAVLRG